MNTFAYLLAVVNSDGYIDKKNYIGLSAVDKEFVSEFAEILAAHIGRKPIPLYQAKLPYGLQWRSGAMRKKLANELRTAKLLPVATEYPRSFLRGVYDSEGNLWVQKRGPTSYQPRYRIWNTNLDLLHACMAALDILDIHASLYLASPKGVRTVGDTIRLKDLYAVRWQGHTSSRIWESQVGSSIPRKRYTGPGPSTNRCPRKYRV